MGGIETRRHHHRRRDPEPRHQTAGTSRRRGGSLDESRYPDRPKFRPTTPTVREAWDLNERSWAATVERARMLDPEQLHESVNGEWSFIQTLRHLAFASESWVGRCILGDPHPWHPLSLPWDEMKPRDGVPHNREARPSLQEALTLRHEAMALVRRVVTALTDEQLDEQTAPLVGPGWPDEGETFPVRECLSIVLSEEWQHRLYAERDWPCSRTILTCQRASRRWPSARRRRE